MNVLKNKKAILIFLAPAFLVYSAIVIFPIFQTFYLSMFEWNGVSDKVFIGIENFKHIFNDRVFIKALTNNLVYIAVIMFLQIIIGLIVAILVTYLNKFKSTIRTLYYLPAVITVVAITQMFRSIYSYEPLGLLNTIFVSLGLEPVAWLSNFKTALVCVSYVEGWQFIGVYMLIFYGALVSVPKDIVEAAEIDGAKKLSVLYHIKLPYIKNVIGLSMILSLVGALRGFAVPLLLTRGGPGNQTEILATFMYKKAFNSIKLGYGSAVAVVIIVICFVGVSIIKKLTNEEEI